MPIEVIMPKVDMDMASGRILSWHVAEGRAVSKGEPLFDIETDKAAMEIEAPADGILQHTAAAGMEIPIGAPCAWLYAEGEEVRDQPEASAGSAAAAVEPASTGRGGAPDKTELAETEAEQGDNIRATPRARSLAADAGLDIATVSGSGPRGRVQADDVQGAQRARLARAAPSLPPAGCHAETGELAITRSQGGTGTPIILIHGFASDASSWAALGAHLKHRPLIQIDLPGHGKSPKLRVDSFADLVKSVRRAFDGLGVERAHLVGHSLGGAAGLALADTRPERLASLALIAPAGLGPDINSAALSGICHASRPESLRPWLRSLVANEAMITDAYVRLAMSSRSAPALRAAQIALADILFPDRAQAFDLRAALDRIKTPTRIIWGKQDAIIPWRHALRAPGKMGLHLFEGIGHMPHIECAAAVGAIVQSYT